jgi:hypothetical protein
MHLKSRFRTLRAVKEGRVITVSSEDDMKLLHSKIRTLLSDIEVCKMQKSALQAKIVKQTRKLKDSAVRVPDPPVSLSRRPSPEKRPRMVDAKTSPHHVP